MMKASEELRYDHEVLRGKLSLLNEYLPCLPCAHLTLASIMQSLGACLRSHIEREERLLAGPAARSGKEEAFQRLAQEHDRQLARVSLLQHLLEARTHPSDSQIGHETLSLVQALRDHMVLEEQDYFPLLDDPMPEPAEPLIGSA